MLLIISNTAQDNDTITLAFFIVDIYLMDVIRPCYSMKLRSRKDSLTCSSSEGVLGKADGASGNQ